MRNKLESYIDYQSKMENTGIKKNGKMHIIELSEVLMKSIF